MRYNSLRYLLLFLLAAVNSLVGLQSRPVRTATNRPRSIEQHASMDLSACRGIQHPKLASIGNDDAVRSYCREKYTYLGGGWRSNDCLLVVGPGAPKQRCVICTSGHSNIRPARHPNLYSERTAVAADTTDRAPAEQPAARLFPKSY